MPDRINDMKSAPPRPLTELLDAWRAGDGSALSGLFNEAYAELRAIAAARLSRTGPVTFSPTELLNESVVRVLNSGVTWQNRAHFMASMSLHMRTVLVDQVRARSAERRGGDIARVSLSAAIQGEESAIADLLALDQALRKLEDLDPRGAAVLQLTCFAGLGRHEIAEVLQISVQAVDREWRFAKSWLNLQLETRL